MTDAVKASSWEMTQFVLWSLTFSASLVPGFCLFQYTRYLQMDFKASMSALGGKNLPCQVWGLTGGGGGSRVEEGL